MDKIEVVFTEDKEKYLQKIAKQREESKKKKQIYGMLTNIFFALSIPVLPVMAYRFATGDTGPSPLYIVFLVFLCMTIIFGGLARKATASCRILMKKESGFLDFYDKYKAGNILDVYCSTDFRDKFLNYVYEENNLVKTGKMVIDVYERWMDIEKTSLTFGDKVICKVPYNNRL